MSPDEDPIEDVVREALDDDEVVRHEPVPALDEGESALALADARVAEEERPEAADLEEDAVQSRARRERLLEKRGEAFDDDARHARRHEERDVAPAAEARENRTRVDPLRDDDAGHRKRREGIEALAGDARREESSGRQTRSRRESGRDSASRRA